MERVLHLREAGGGLLNQSLLDLVGIIGEGRTWGRGPRAHHRRAPHARERSQRGELEGICAVDFPGAVRLCALQWVDAFHLLQHAMGRQTDDAVPGLLFNSALLEQYAMG